LNAEERRERYFKRSLINEKKDPKQDRLLVSAFEISVEIEEGTIVRNPQERKIRARDGA